MKYIKSWKVFESEQPVLTYASIIDKYFSEFSDIYNTYKFKWILTKQMEYFKKLNKDTSVSGLDVLNKYIDKIAENKTQIISDYNSDWINFLGVKIPEGVNTYSQYVSRVTKKLYGKEYKFGSAHSLLTTNIKTFKEIVVIVNSKLPKEYQFDFGIFKTISTIDNKDFIKCLIHFNIFNDETTKKLVDHLNKMNTHITKNDEYFVRYMKDKFNIVVNKASTQEDIKGIDFISEDGITYQLKYPANIKLYKSGYFISNESPLDIKSIEICNKLALYDKSKNMFYILDIKDLDFQQGANGLFIKTLF